MPPFVVTVFNRPVYTQKSPAKSFIRREILHKHICKKSLKGEWILVNLLKICQLSTARSITVEAVNDLLTAPVW